MEGIFFEKRIELRILWLKGGNSNHKIIFFPENIV